MLDSRPAAIPIVAPRPPAAAAPFRFPVIASVAPLVVALILWLVTESPFALLFAVLGPVTAVAGFVDSRFSARRGARREAERFHAEVIGTSGRVDRAHAGERASLIESFPSGAALLERFGADPYRWRVRSEEPILITVGNAVIESRVRLEGAGTAGDGGRNDAALHDVRTRSMTLGEAPLALDARLGIGVCGPPVLAIAAARAIACQLAWALSPARYWVAAETNAGPRAGRDTGAGTEAWGDDVPHLSHPARPGFFIEFGALPSEGGISPTPGRLAPAGRPPAMVSVAVATNASDLPGGCQVVLDLRDGVARVLQHPDRSLRVEFLPGLVSEQAAGEWMRRLRADALQEGLIASTHALPTVVPLAPMLRGAGSRDRNSLSCEFAVGPSGPVSIDLVHDGPHAVIGGTTGSGKSELLVAWVVAMSAAYGPEQVNFLLVDFKGGSAFAALSGLRHVVGTITDLDAVGAARALSSIRAELRYRERSLAEAGSTTISQLVDVPRLVIVVDEFAAMLTDHPDLHGLFVDIAARGRSLGVHLILCTQRPAGVVRDAIMANADLRMCMRVNNVSDSALVTGTPAAATIPASARGRGILRLAEGDAVEVQFARATSEGDSVLAVTLRDVGLRWVHSATPRAPWLPPLPAIIDAAEIASLRAVTAPRRSTAACEPMVFGVLDIPREQRRSLAEWNPQEEGNLLVLGCPRAGKTGALLAFSAIASSSGRQFRWCPGDPALAWDEMSRLRGMLLARSAPSFPTVPTSDARAPVIVALDDLDALVARFGPEYRETFLERLSTMLRDGSSGGIHFVIAAQRITSDIQFLAALLPARVLLRQASKNDHVMAGGTGADYLPNLGAGGGLWHGDRVQVMHAHRGNGSDAPTVALEVAHLRDERRLAVVTSRPVEILERFGDRAVRLADSATASVSPQSVVIGDVDEWLSRYGIFGAMVPVADIVFDRCSVADYRAITRARELPPLLPTPHTAALELCWLRGTDGVAHRTALPAR